MRVGRQLLNFIVRHFGLNFVRSETFWELIEARSLRQFIEAFQIDCVFDVGANLGEYAGRLRRLGFAGLIISFEPNPDAVRHLKNSVKGQKNWIIKDAALDSHPRTLDFNVMRISAFSSFHEPDHVKTSRFRKMNIIERKLRITTQTLNDLYPALQSEFGFSRPFLKLDTQGHDLYVVEGASNCLSGFVGLQSELNFTTLYKDTPEAKNALMHFENLGFRLSALVPNTEGHFPDLYEIDCIMYNPFFKRSKLYRPTTIRSEARRKGKA